MKILVFALKEEDLLPDYPDCVKIYTGVGKINAAMKLTEVLRALSDTGEVPLVINFGTAGGVSKKKGDFIECSDFYQFDMDCSSLGMPKYKTPYEEDIFIQSSKQHLNAIGTADTFITSRKDLPSGIDAVDMEAYALAKVCKYFRVPFRCFKYITDECDSKSHDDWKENLHRAKPHFEEVMKNLK